MRNTERGQQQQRAPVFFIGHGSPMNALEDNAFTRSLKSMREIYPDPQAILCISAHWMTEGSWVTAMAQPKTIHDFYGFPQELFEIQYPAPGDPQIAGRISDIVQDPKVYLDKETWGLDHGTWSVLRHVFPEAKIPVLQLSLYMEQPAEYHFKLGTELRKLRDQGILIVGSGNVVHNLRKIRWEPDAKAYDWAIECDEWIKSQLTSRDLHSLIEDYQSTDSRRLSIPTPEHYYPLLYILGAAENDDDLRFIFEGIQNGSISMRTFSFGAKGERL